MPHIVNIALADLLVDTQNARLKDEQPNQQTALLSLATQQDKKLLKLASDIVKFGLDPLTLPAVILSSNLKGRYMVIEGNRRITALKALENPSLVSAAMSGADQRKLVRLASDYAKKPISHVVCVLFDSETELTHWVDLRHTGQNEGIGLVEWGADEKDRWAARHGRRSPEGQIIDFVERIEVAPSSTAQEKTRINSNIARLIGTPEVRKKIGIDISDGRIYTHFPDDEIAKSLVYLVQELKADRLKVAQIYRKNDRISYINSLPEDKLPAPSSRLERSQLLGNVGSEAPPSKSG